MFAGVAVKEKIIGHPSLKDTVGAVVVSSSRAESHDVKASKDNERDAIKNTEIFFRNELFTHRISNLNKNSFIMG